MAKLAKTKRNLQKILSEVWSKLRKKQKPISLIDSVSELIKEHEHDPQATREEFDILENFVDFGDLKTSDVMIPRTNIIGIPHNAKYNDVKAIILKAGHTRFPVYKESLDSVIGFLHAKDFMRFIDTPQAFSVSKILRDILYAPKVMRIADLLGKMRKSRTHIAIILDEYGGTEGLVTIGDVVEEIIGDIMDEHDVNTQAAITLGADGKFIITGAADIEAVEEKLGVSLSEEDGDYETFSGFIMAYLGKIPATGEKFVHPSGIDVQITEADARHIIKTVVSLQQ